jgi:hypothetical protein
MTRGWQPAVAARPEVLGRWHTVGIPCGGGGSAL